MYHPGGIDYDGENIWVPVGEYRRDSRSIIYRVDPATMKATEVFRFADHIGAIVHNTDDHTLHGVELGLAALLPLDAGAGSPRHQQRRAAGAAAHAQSRRTTSTTRTASMSVGAGCSAPASRTYASRPARRRSVWAGWIWSTSSDGRPLHQVPMLLWTSGGLDMTHNPVWIEATASGLRGYFMPEDDRSTIYVYEVTVGP